MTHETIETGVDICLVVPPFASAHFPHLGTAVLKGACEARGFSVRIVYGCLDLAARVGLDAYDAICQAPMRRMVGERLFRPHAYPPETFAALPENAPLSDALQDSFDRVAPAIEASLDAMVDQVLALRPRILGVSTTFQQSLACAAVARRVKMAMPDCCTVMGGANAAWPIANGLARAFPWIDHFFAGESDLDFPDFCERLLRQGQRTDQRVIRSEPIRDMRVVAEPRFDDFFTTLRPLQAAGQLPDWLPRFMTMETSRGCWWGAKNHCTFCGLNGEGMDFRDKPAAQAARELLALAEEWGTRQIHLTDNIMPRQYVDELFPVLAQADPPVELYYEVKANLGPAQVDAMASGGVVAIQPGIESLASDVLRLMRKGVSAHQNIALLRTCRGIAIDVQWGIIYGFPGERAADYAAMIELMPRIAHLQAPVGVNRIIIDRYSPYYKEPERLGIGTLTPVEAYRSLYPADIPTEEIAYHFDGDYSTELLGDPGLIARLEAAVADWKRQWATRPIPVLELFDIGGKAMILDTRAIARQPMTSLSAACCKVLIGLDRPQTRAGLDADVEGEIDWLIARDFVLEFEGKLMSLVVRRRAGIADMTEQETLVSA